MKFTQYKSPQLNGQKVWKFDITIGGLRIRRGGFPTKQKAEQAVAALRIRAMSQQYGLPTGDSDITVGHIIRERSRIPRYKDMDENHWIFKRFLNVVPAKTPVRSLTKSHLRAFVTDCERAGLEPTTINVYLAKVMACLNAATESFPELEDWTAPRIKKLKEGPGRERVLTTDEITRLLAVLRADPFKGERPAGARIRHEVNDIMRLVLLTGAREGEILNLEKTAINYDFRTMQITSHKGQNGLTRTVPLSNLAIEILRARQTTRSRFFSINIHQVKQCFIKIGPLAGVPTGQKTPGGAVFYDLRHTAATVMELAGVVYSTVSAILGHKRKDMTARYTHGSKSSLREAVEVLENWCRGIDGFIQTNGSESVHSGPKLIASGGI